MTLIKLFFSEANTIWRVFEVLAIIILVILIIWKIIERLSLKEKLNKFYTGILVDDFISKQASTPAPKLKADSIKASAKVVKVKPWLVNKASYKQLLAFLVNNKNNVLDITYLTKLQQYRLYTKMLLIKTETDEASDIVAKARHQMAEVFKVYNGGEHIV